MQFSLRYCDNLRMSLSLRQWLRSSYINCKLHHNDNVMEASSGRRTWIGGIQSTNAFGSNTHFHPGQ